jgi:predicted ArsR family transcriptional regulator
MDDKTRSVYELLQESESPLSTNKIAERLDVDWHTAKKRLDRLLEEEKVHRKQWGDNLTLWWDKEIPV